VSLETKTERLSFNGHSGQVGARLLTQEHSTTRLAVVLPGAGYSTHEPLLRYGIQVLLKNGYRVLAWEKVYGDDPEWRSLKTEAEARKVVEEDAVKVFAQIEERFPNSLEVLFGRSLGTFAIACLLERQLVSPKKIVWQTPALGDKWAVMRNSKIVGFGILGTADYYFEQAMKHLPAARIVVENADHAMEIAGDPVRSIEILKQVTAATDRWLGSVSPGQQPDLEA
jgi:hypothetical protein